MEKTDEQLARGAMEGDPEAFGTLVERLRAPLVGYVTGLLGQRDDAEELAQDAFLVAWQRIRGLREPARVGGWIYRIAGRLAGKRASASRPLTLVDDPPAQSCDSAEDQRLIALLAAVAQLSQPHRDVISRKHFAGYQGDEIARQLGIAPGTVRSRLSRAYAELRAMLTGQDGDLRRR